MLETTPRSTDDMIYDIDRYIDKEICVDRWIYKKKYLVDIKLRR